MRSARWMGLLLLAFLANGIQAEQLVIDTLAGTGQAELGLFEGAAKLANVAQPFGVELDAKGHLYITEVGNHRILKVDANSGKLSTVAGNGEKGYSGDGGLATKARLNEPYEVRFDREGNMYFVEMANAVIRYVDAKSGTISTVCGTGEHGYCGDGGPATKAMLQKPHSLALDSEGNIYIADIGNHRIRRVDHKTGVIESVAGNGERQPPIDGSRATGKPILGPRALHIVGDTLWIALREGHSVWKMDLGTRRMSHIAGVAERGNRDGVGKEARFNGPKGIVQGADGMVYVVDTENQTIRKVDPRSGKVTTVAGGGPTIRGFGGDGGPALESKLNRPHGITIDKNGTFYIGDTLNHRVRRVRSWK